MKSEDGLIDNLVGFVFGIVLGFVVATYACLRDNEGMQLRFQKEALDRGYATYESNANGSPKFTWKEKQ